MHFLASLNETHLLNDQLPFPFFTGVHNSHACTRSARSTRPSSLARRNRVELFVLRVTWNLMNNYFFNCFSFKTHNSFLHLFLPSNSGARYKNAEQISQQNVEIKLILESWLTRPWHSSMCQCSHELQRGAQSANISQFPSIPFQARRYVPCADLCVVYDLCCQLAQAPFCRFFDL